MSESEYTPEQNREAEIERRRAHSQLRAEYIVRDYARTHPDGQFAKAFAAGIFSAEESYALLNEFARDPKTGVLRSDYMGQVLEYETNYSREHENETLTLAMIDIDNFKQLNTDLGYQSADDILKSVASTITRQIRRSDESTDVPEVERSTGKEVLATDDVIRFGGEEFIVMFSSTTQEQATIALERIRLSIEEQFAGRTPEQGHVTVSIGVTEYDATKKEEWRKTLDRANAALQEAKQSGKNKIIALDKQAAPSELPKVA